MAISHKTHAMVTSKNRGGRVKGGKTRKKRGHGVVPPNLRKHAEVICVLAKAKPRLVKQLIAGAGAPLLRTFSECAGNILKGNLQLTAQQKKKLKRYAKTLRTLRRRTGTAKTKKALLMKGGFVGALAGVLAPLLMKVAGPLLSGILR